MNWTSPLFSNLVKDHQLKNQNARHLESSSGSGNSKQSDFNKNDPITIVQGMHNSKCTKCFENETVACIRYGKEEFIYNDFGYLSCCDEGL